ncbi:hypothetical protein HDC90_001420 [Pedobacter sp. AK013]|uniref:LA_2272 family surface repeat-containing protein n=1 Tax=Pedobacter sp. AK013 TaxID=2723071 RepID=UPI001615D360|nr:hypothetical protein [Pedobacter sp. AK013]MBB6236805.1 hypothetical protein [Pedobacter sp. AK013]
MKSKIMLITQIALLLAVKVNSQIRENHFPVGTFHQSNVRITGISYGIFTGLSEKDTNVITNGLRLEAIGTGLLLPLAPHGPVYKEEDLIPLKDVRFTEMINGLNLSGSGTIGDDCIVNGVTLGAIGQYLYAMNGISISILCIVVEKQNGLQLSAFNDVHKGNGMQMGIGNSAVYYNGIQLGLLGNKAVKSRGMQVALFNESKDLKGVQIGLWNTNQKRKLPLINWNFKG